MLEEIDEVLEVKEFNKIIFKILVSEVILFRFGEVCIYGILFFLLLMELLML